MKLSLYIGMVGCGAAQIEAQLIAQREPLSQQAISLITPKDAEYHTAVKAFYDGPMALEAWLGDYNDDDHILLIAPRLSRILWPAQHLAQNAAALSHICSEHHVFADIDEPAAMILRIYQTQILAGRDAPLTLDIEGRATEKTGLPASIDIGTYLAPWIQSFDITINNVSSGPRIPFDIADKIAPLQMTWPKLESDETLERMRQLTVAQKRLKSRGDTLYSAISRQVLFELAAIDGPPIAKEGLQPILERIAPNLTLLKDQGHLSTERLSQSSIRPAAWTPPPLSHGFRATQYLVAARHEMAARARRAAKSRERAFSGALLRDLRQHQRSTVEEGLTGKLPQWAKPMLRELLDNGDFAQHRPLERPQTPFPTQERPYPNSLIIACMKDEGPYLLDWIAFHQSIGFEQFLIYANNCSDGTDQMLERLDQLGHITYRPNNSFGEEGPQIHALRVCKDEPLFQNARVLCHIDTDEFINIQCGDGTLHALQEASNGATHIALSWRMFGHGGQVGITQSPIFEQNRRAAPTHCPFPHYIHGIKTLAFDPHLYASLGAHRPKELDPLREGDVKWINGAGHDFTKRYRDHNWRSNRRSVGYDLVELNHYALRSLHGFAVKQTRGRALHVDEAIGAYYWMRMDWNDVTETSILRHRPRFEPRRDAFLRDPELRALHNAAIMWHKETASQALAHPHTARLLDQLHSSALSATERMAYCLAYQDPQTTPPF